MPVNKHGLFPAALIEGWTCLWSRGLRRPAAIKAALGAVITAQGNIWCQVSLLNCPVAQWRNECWGHGKLTIMRNPEGCLRQACHLPPVVSGMFYWNSCKLRMCCQAADSMSSPHRPATQHAYKPLHGLCFSRYSLFSLYFRNRYKMQLKLHCCQYLEYFILLYYHLLVIFLWCLNFPVGFPPWTASYSITTTY